MICTILVASRSHGKYIAECNDCYIVQFLHTLNGSKFEVVQDKNVFHIFHLQIWMK